MVKEGKKSAQEQEIHTDAAINKQNSQTSFFNTAYFVRVILAVISRTVVQCK